MPMKLIFIIITSFKILKNKLKHYVAFEKKNIGYYSHYSKPYSNKYLNDSYFLWRQNKRNVYGYLP